MSIRSMKSIAQALAATGALSGLLALAPSAAVAGDSIDFGKGVFSPAKGVICDRQAGFCADGTGISMSFTEQYLGADAAHKFIKQMEGGYDDQNYVLMNGISCQTQKQKCFKTKYSEEVAGKLTKRLFQ